MASATTQLEQAREVYRLLSEIPQGLTGAQLAERLGTDKRGVRDIMNRCRKEAAMGIHSEWGLTIVGYDPARERYVIAKDQAQAERVILYYHSYVEDMAVALELMSQAYVSHYGVKPPKAVQGTLTDITGYQANMGIKKPEKPIKRFEIQEGAELKKCSSCQRPIYWIVTPNKKRMPVNPDGTSHFGNCPHSEVWSGSSRAEMEAA